MATIVEMINPLTGLPEQVDKLDHTAQEIDDAVDLAPQLSNPNLLDNWYFCNPINQRGQTSYSGGGYGLDRWNSLGASVVTVNDGSVTFTSGATISTGCHMAQYLENYSDLSSITVTLSVLVKDISGKFEFFIGGTYVGAIQEPGLYFWTTQKDTSEIAVKFYNGNEGSAFIELTAIKLELGTAQTLAHQDADGNWVLNEIPDYGEQLARCQRYFQTFATESLRPTNALDFRPVMRATPALSTITVGGKTLYTASADL